MVQIQLDFYEVMSCRHFAAMLGESLRVCNVSSNRNNAPYIPKPSYLL